MAVFLVRINAGDLLNIDDIGTMGANKLLAVEQLFKIGHGFVFEKIPFRGMNLHVIVGCFQVVHIVYGNDLDLAAVFHHDAIVLHRRLGGSFE